MSRVVSWDDSDTISDDSVICMMILLGNGLMEINKVLYECYAIGNT
jgi:hypothetical protein